MISSIFRFVRPCSYAFVRSCGRTCFRLLVRVFVRSYVCADVIAFVRSCVRAFVRSCVRAFVRSFFVRSLARSFNYFFLYFVTLSIGRRKIPWILGNVSALHQI